MVELALSVTGCLCAAQVLLSLVVRGGSFESCAQAFCVLDSGGATWTQMSCGEVCPSLAFRWRRKGAKGV